jgi:TonB-dependent receptor
MKKILFSLLLSFSVLQIFAQRSGIRGTIIDKTSGEGLIGATVIIDGTKIATSTDLDGTFVLNTVPGTYSVTVSYVSYKPFTVKDVIVKNDYTALNQIFLEEDNNQLGEVVVTAKLLKTTEEALMIIRKKSVVMMDGISASRMKITGDATAVEAAKRITGVSIEGGKYVYVRGLSDRYTKTTMNGLEIPGLDPDKNTIQMDIFPTTLIDNIIVSKNFSAEMPADFTGGLLNVTTKDFPEEKLFNVSVSTSYNPAMHFNSDNLTYSRSKTDFLGFDDGMRALPELAKLDNIPTPISGASKDAVNSFVSSFSNELAAQRKTSFMDYGLGVSFGNQFNLKKKPTSNIGYIVSLAYKTDQKYYDNLTYGEYQRNLDPKNYEMRYATLQEGQMSEQNVLVGLLGGIAYKSKFHKIRFNALQLQNGESRAAKFDIQNDGEAVGQSGYVAKSDNLEYNQRSLSNLLLNGVHILGQKGWELDWRTSTTLSKSTDPDIRKTAFTYTPSNVFFSAGAGGNPSRIWRYLDEMNWNSKIDVIKRYTYKNVDAKLSFGANHLYKERNYEIRFYDIQFFSSQTWKNPVAEEVLNASNLYPNRPNSIYYQSGNNNPNPNKYNSNLNIYAGYISNDFNILPNLKTIIGLRGEYFTQKHTGRDQAYANGNLEDGRNLNNETVLQSFDLFPTANFIFTLKDVYNLRASYSKTIARPSFKELSFAQIIDPITNRIFNGSLFTYPQWNGELVETRIDNLDFRIERFMDKGQIISFSVFYKKFKDPIELVRIPEQQTSTEYQARNVGTGTLYGIEFEFSKNLHATHPLFSKINLNGNFSFIESKILMTDVEINARRTYLKDGEILGDKRDMAGQSPYTVNLGIGYNDAEEKGLSAGLFYNVKGSTLTIVGGGLFPDIYSEPFHSVNFGLNKRIGKEGKAAIDFKASNLLNDSIDIFYKSVKAQDQVFSKMQPGRNFSLGLSYRL